MPRKPKAKPQNRTLDRVSMTLDKLTLEGLEAVQAAHPEVESMSAAVRFLVRQWVAQKKTRKNPE